MDLRNTGIEVVGQAPWGTHFCQFYATKDDLADTLVPYFKAGLEGGEYCMWVTSPPLDAAEAWEALAQAVPDLEQYRGRGRIEIIPHTDWYVIDGRFDQDRVLDGWVRKLNAALARGCSGLRLSGNTFWLEKSDWRSFADYEAAVDGVLGQYRMLALCTYSLDRCGASEVADVIKNHEFALIKRDGQWEIFESFDRRRLQDALTAERERLAVTLKSIGDAVIATDTAGRITTLNGVAEELTGWSQADAFGKPHEDVFRIFDEVTGAATRDPVATVLERGVVIGLENQTALVRRDGTQISIADSAAPIRGRDGAILGVVLVFRDVTEERRTAEALRASHAELREADRSKNRFLAALSHELRNPLAPIKNSLYVLDHAVPGGDQARRAQDVIGRQLDQLARLVDDLLDVTRISTDKIQLQRERLELNELVRRTVEDYRSLFERRGVELELIAAPEPLLIHGDWNRLAQVIGNLLQNAVKFTARGGSTIVTLESWADRGKAVIRVADTGIGIASEMLARLFEPFVQAASSLDRSAGGLGLGLALVKGLVELHGGEIAAHSAGLGAGTELVVTLPLESGAVAIEPEVAGPAKRPASRRVLVIEDNLDAADSLREALELGGHRVEVAYTGPAGIAKARELLPEAVLCDIGLPGLDGYEVARAFRADSALKGTFLVALSGYALPDDHRRASDAGFDRHLAKPPDIDQIGALLSELPVRAQPG